MKLFGFNISKAQASQGGNKNKFTQNALWSWAFGKVWADTQDKSSLLNAYKSWVYVCASRNAATFAATPLRLYVAKTSGKQKLLAPTRPITIKQARYFQGNPKIASLPQVVKSVEIEEVTEHPSIELLHNVNPFMNQTDLFEISDVYEELTGNAYWYVVRNAMGVPEQIWPLPPDRVGIVPDRETFIKEYRFFNGMEDGEPIELDEMVHFKFPNPNDMYYGASPLQAVSNAYNINQNMSNYENALFTNNARPEGFWTTEQELDASDIKVLKTQLAEMWQGVFNSGKTGITSHGLKYSPLNLPPRELGFLKGREWTKKEIFEAFDTPEGLFNDKANRANAEAAQFVYAKYCIQPRHRRFEEKLNEQFAPMYDEKLFFAFDNVVPEDQELSLKVDVELSKIGAVSIDEIRADRGKEPLPDNAGAIPFIGRGFIPVTAAALGIAEEPEEPEDTTEDDEKFVRAISDDIVKELLKEAV